MRIAAVRVVSWFGLMLLTLLLTGSVVECRRGGKGRSKGRIQIDKGNAVGQSDLNSRQEYYNGPKGARMVKASHFDYEYVLGHKIVFICEAKGTPRPHITWFKDGMELYAHPYMQIREWKIATDKIKSRMEIDPATQMDAGTYECHANNKFAIDRRSFRADFSISE